MMSASSEIKPRAEKPVRSSQADKFLSVLERLRHSKTIRHAAFIIALLIFGIGLAACFLAMPDILSRIELKPFLIVFLIGVPLTICLNAIEFILTGHLIEKKFKALSAFKITLFATAANMLPLPGAAVVRIAALKDKGAGLAEGTRATFAVGIIWLGVSLVYSGYWMLEFMRHAAFLTILAGLGALAFGSLLGLRRYKKIKTTLSIIALKIVTTLLVTLRLIFCLWAIGAIVTFPEAATMAAADVIGSAIMVVPSGIGINEAMTAFLAQIAGVSAALGFMAALINRLATLLALCPITLYLYVASAKQNSTLS